MHHIVKENHFAVLLSCEGEKVLQATSHLYMNTNKFKVKKIYRPVCSSLYCTTGYFEN